MLQLGLHVNESITRVGIYIGPENMCLPHNFFTISFDLGEQNFGDSVSISCTEIRPGPNCKVYQHDILHHSDCWKSK